MRSLVISAVLVGMVAPALAADTWTDPFPGVRRLRRVTSNQHVNVLVVDLCAPGVSVRATKSNERQRTVGSFGALVGAQAAINGDFFSFETYSTNGPAASGGAVWGGPDDNGDAPLQFGNGQVALPPHESTAGLASWAREVVSGHPTLMANGVARNNTSTLCTARHPRTAVGLSADKTKLFLAVIDGRATNRIGMTCNEVQSLLKDLGAADALNLDGGGSSTMWLAGTGVVNNPSDGNQRVVANHLAIKATGTGPAPHCVAREPAATFAGMEAPLELTSGEEAVVWLEFQNTGNTAWTIANTRVGTQDPQDRASVFYKEENWVSPSRPTPPDHNYDPGTLGRFTWAMVAPEVTETTTFEETFQLVEEGVGWFGEKQTMTIVVHPVTGPTTPTTPPGDAGPDDGEPSDGDGGASEPGGCATGSPVSLVAGLGVLGLACRRRRRSSPRSVT